MKNIKKIIIAIITLFVFEINAYAASASIAVSSSANQVIVGKTFKVFVTVSSSTPLGAWEYTLNYDSSVFKLNSSDVGLHYASYANNASTKSVTYTYVFSALKSGSSNFYIDSSNVISFDEASLSVSDGSKKITAITYAEYQASLSANNNLASIAVEGFEISPEFNKDTMEYTVKVNEDTKEINIIAKPEDNTATINGAGTFEVSAGNNSFNVIVIAQNGSEKTYKLNVEVTDKYPIEVKVDNKKYTVVKIKDNLTKPESYNETIIKINNFDIPAFYSEITDYNLVGLKDEQGKIELYIYEDGKYTKYVELKSGNITIYPLEMNTNIKKYSKSSFEVNSNKIECLEINNKSRVKLIYGLNVETGEKGLFLYDTKDNTIMKYDDEYINIINNQNKILLICTIAFASISFVSLIMLACVSKKKKDKPKQKKIKQIKTQETQITKEKPIIDENNEDSQEEINIKDTQEDINEIIEDEEVYDIFEDDKKKKTKKKNKSDKK